MIVFNPTNLLKSKKMPIGTVSKGRKKVAEGDWREVKKGASKVSASGVSFTIPELRAVKQFQLSSDHYDPDGSHWYVVYSGGWTGKTQSGVLSSLKKKGKYKKYPDDPKNFGLIRADVVDAAKSIKLKPKVVKPFSQTKVGKDRAKAEKAKAIKTVSKPKAVKKPLPKPKTKMVVSKTASDKYVIWGVAPGKDYEDLLVSEKVEVTAANMGQMKKKLESMGVTKIRFSKLEPLTDSTEVGRAFKGAVSPVKKATPSGVVKEKTVKNFTVTLSYERGAWFSKTIHHPNGRGDSSTTFDHYKSHKTKGEALKEYNSQLASIR